MAQQTLKGIAASDGIAIAPVFLLAEPDLSFDKVIVSDPQGEVDRLDKAVQDTMDQIDKVQETARERLGEEEAQVFDAHRMFLLDPEFIGQVKSQIESDHVNAEHAMKTTADTFITMFQAMEDNPYMQERAADVKDVSERILANLLGVHLANPADIDQEVIVVAHDLTPSDTAQLNKKYVKAFVTNIGGRTSHSAIMARSLEIPAVVGTESIVEEVQEGDLIIVDAIEGTVILNPSQDQVEEYRAKGEAFEQQKAEWAKLVDADSITADGHQVELAANIGTPKDVEGAVNNGAEGIGLYRTEFLYMDSSDFPTEEEQFESYKSVLEGMDGKPVVVRTMDIGGDKELPYLQLPEEMNPFLGYRAIRISLEETEMFKTQLRALLRASVYGELRIMFPMVATVDEFRAAKAVFEEVKAELVAEGVEVSDQIQLGIMIEIPAAAIMADKLAEEVDFFSVGTNDLIQYSMAADRMNERVSYLYQPYHPAILRLLKHVIDSAHAQGKWAGMCGEMAGDQTAIPLLIGLGLDEFSMSASSILKSRDLISRLNHQEMVDLADKAIRDCSTSQEVVDLVNEALAK